MPKKYDDVAHEETMDRLKEAPKEFRKEVEKRFDKVKNWDKGKISQELSRANLAEGSNASYTPKYIPSLGSPRSVSLRLALKAKKLNDEVL